MKKYIIKYKWLLLFSFALTVVTAFGALYQPQLISNIINDLNQTNDYGQVEANLDGIYANGKMLVAVGIMTLLAGIFNTFVSAKISQGLGADIRIDGFKKIQTFSFEDIEKFSAGKLVVRLTNDVTQIQNFVMVGLQLFIRVPILFVGAFILAVQALPGLWWTIILYVVIVGLVMGLTMARLAPLFTGMQTDVDELNTIVKENMDGVRVVKSFVTEKKENTRFEKKVLSYTDKVIKTGATFSIVVPTFMLVANIMTAVGLYFVADWAVSDPALIGSFVSYMTYMMQIMFALVMIGMLMATISRALVSYKRINEIFETDSTMAFGAEELTSIESIEFKDVSFTYLGEDTSTLDNISFKINAGEKIGVVGATGSGKTTLVHLISRLYDPTSGEILLNGKPMSVYEEKSLRDRMSMVLQKAILFKGTIEDNIMQGKHDATNEEMVKAAQDAQAYEFISTKEGQFDAEVQEKGSNFSGGQKQRISISRGLVANPDLLILDDSTSALDARSERLVKEAINKLNNTTVFVSQKISTIVDMDKIIVLKDGTISAIGTHKELVKSSEAYQEIYNTQKAKEVK